MDSGLLLNVTSSKNAAKGAKAASKKPAFLSKPKFGAVKSTAAATSAPSRAASKPVRPQSKEIENQVQRGHTGNAKRPAASNFGRPQKANDDVGAGGGKGGSSRPPIQRKRPGNAKPASSQESLPATSEEPRNRAEEQDQATAAAAEEANSNSQIGSRKNPQRKAPQPTFVLPEVQDFKQKKKTGDAAQKPHRSAKGSWFVNTSASDHLFNRSTSFDDLKIDTTLVSRVKAPVNPLTNGLHSGLGLDVPTIVQSLAIPVLLERRDSFIKSETGSGKTLAYLVRQLSSQPNRFSHNLASAAYGA